MESIKISDCKATLINQTYERDKIRIMWQWVKTNHINLSQYILLTEWLFKDGCK